MDDHLMVPILRPVVTIITSEKLNPSIIKFISEESKYQMDWEKVNQNYSFKQRRDQKTIQKKIEGIFKSSWAMTIRKLIPSVILLVFNFLNSEPTDWKSYENFIISEIKRYRDFCKGRLVKITLICAYAIDDSIDKKENLKKYAEVNRKGILFVKDFEEVKKAKKLKKYIWTSSLKHYKYEIARIEKFKNKFQKNTNKAFPEIELRYAFKLGFYYEIIKEKEVAIGLYKKCYYDAINCYKSNAINQDELRTFSDKILYRMHCILLQASIHEIKIEQSVSMLRTHLQVFKGPHTSIKTQQWVTDHLSQFSDLLLLVHSDVIDPTDTWQHYGFFCISIGNYYINRMRISVLDPEFMLSVTNWEDFITKNSLAITNSSYLGQIQSFKSSISQDLVEGITLPDQDNIILTLKESKIQHLQFAMDYMFKALKFYNTKLNMPRISTWIGFCVSKIFKFKGDLENFYKNLAEIAEKIQGWDIASASVLEDLVGNTGDLDQENYANWILQLMRLRFRPELLEKLKKLVTRSLQVPSIFAVKAKFSHKLAQVYKITDLIIAIDNPIPIKIIVTIEIYFSDSRYNAIIPGICLENKTRIQHKILITSFAELLTVVSIKLKYFIKNDFFIDFVSDCKSSVSINPPDSQLALKFEHKFPVLIGEETILNLSFQELSPIKNIYIEFFEEIDEDSNTINSVYASDMNKSFSAFIEDVEAEKSKTPVSDLIRNGNLECKLLFKYQKTYKIQLKVAYTVLASDSISYPQEITNKISIPAISPFFSTITVIKSFQIDIKIIKVILQNNYFEELNLLSIINQTDDRDTNKNINILLDTSHNYIETFKINFLKTSLGSYNLKVYWNRLSGPFKSYNVPYKVHKKIDSALFLDVKAPEECFVFRVFKMSVKIFNKSNDVITVTISIQDALNFLVSGLIKNTLAISPTSEYKLDYQLVPLSYGIHKIPSITVAWDANEYKWEGKKILII